MKSCGNHEIGAQIQKFDVDAEKHGFIQNRGMQFQVFFSVGQELGGFYADLFRGYLS